MYACAVENAYTKPEQAAMTSNAAALRVADGLLHQRGRRRHPVVRREGREQDQVDVVRVDAGRADRPERGDRPIDAVVSCAAATRRSRIPVRVLIHSSFVSTIRSRSALVRTWAGAYRPSRSRAHGAGRSQRLHLDQRLLGLDEARRSRRRP